MINSVSLVIPVFNNDKTLSKYLKECYLLLKDTNIKFEIIICNDGSTDKSLQIMQEFKDNHKNIFIINHKKNLGIASSLKDLYKYANNKYTLLFSADGGWKSADVLRLVRHAIKTDGDIIIGKRNNKQYTLIRRVISFFYNLFPKILFGKNLYDVGSIKIFRTEIYKKIKTQSTSVFFEGEFLIKALNLGYEIQSISVSHQRNNKIKSGVNYKIVFDSFVDVIKMRFKI